MIAEEGSTPFIIAQKSFFLYAGQWLKAVGVFFVCFFMEKVVATPNYIKDKKISACFLVQNEVPYDDIVVLITLQLTIGDTCFT